MGKKKETAVETRIPQKKMDLQQIRKYLHEEPPTRVVSLDLRETQAEDHSVALAFSSEEPVVRWWGIEIMDHSTGAMRTTRTAKGLPLLFNHDRDALLGRLYGIGIGEDRVARGVAKFDDFGVGAEKYRQVQAGSLTDVSVGYMVHYVGEVKTADLSDELVRLSEENKLPVYRITDWEPFEASLVTVAADPTVGVGRTAPIRIGGEPEESPGVEPKLTATKTVVVEARKVMGDKINVEQEREIVERASKAAEARISGIYDLGTRHGMPKETVEKAVRDGMPIDQFMQKVLEHVESRPEPLPISDLGLSAKERKRYSISKAILSRDNESSVDAGFERECHREIEKRVSGSVPLHGGMLVPYDITRQQAARRDLTVGTAAAGGYLVGTDHLGAEFIDILRNTMLLRRLGARVISGLRGNVNIPRRTAGVTTYWLPTEGTGPSESSNTFGQLALSPKSLGARLDYTRNLLIQSNPSIDGLINGDFAVAMALGIDAAGFHGTGVSGQPAGIENTTGIGSVVGTSINYAKMLEFQTDLASGNALSVNTAYVTTPAVASLLAQRVKFASTASPLWVGSILEGTDVCGLRGYTSNQIGAAKMFFGDFSQVIIAEWGVLELVIDPYTQSANGIIQTTAFQSVDIGVRYPTAFSLATSIT